MHRSSFSPFSQEIESEPRRSLTGVTIPKPEGTHGVIKVSGGHHRAEAGVFRGGEKKSIFLKKEGFVSRSSQWIDSQQHKHRGSWVQKLHSHSYMCLLMFNAAMPPCGAAGYMEGMLVVMKSAICCRASKLVGVFPFLSWSWIIVSSSSQKACKDAEGHLRAGLKAGHSVGNQFHQDHTRHSYF